MKRLRAVIDRAFRDVPGRERSYLQQVAQRGFSESETAAVVLGLDLWRDEIALWRNRFSQEEKRPSMWQFDYVGSAGWDVGRWRSLPLAARVLRARVGSLAHEIGHDGLIRASVKLAREDRRIEVLQAAGFAEAGRTGLRFHPIASPDALSVDLALVIIVTHWLGACAVADRIADQRSTEEVEIHGYTAACRLCRAAWGIVENERWKLPPLHPACRCFAQPVYRT